VKSLNGFGRKVAVWLGAIAFSAGVSAQPLLTPSPASIEFGDVELGLSKSSVLSIRNSGTEPLVIERTGITLPFRFSPGECLETLPVTIAIGEECQQTIIFEPEVQGNTGDSYVILRSNTTGVADTPTRIPLDGTGTASGPFLRPVPSEVDFGSVKIGEYKDFAVSLQNEGIGDVTVSNISALTSPFSRIPVDPIDAYWECGALPYDIPFIEYCQINIRYTPVSIGEAIESLVITSNSSGSPDTISLKGLSGPSLSLQPTGGLDFGSLGLGATGTRSIVLSNTGSDEVTVASIAGLSGDFSLVSAGSDCPQTYPFPLPPGASCQQRISFAPSTIGDFVQEVIISSDSLTNPDTVMVTGQGISGEFTFTPEALDFGEVLIGSQSATQSISIKATKGIVLETLELPSGDFILISADNCYLSSLPGLPATLPFPIDCELVIAFAPNTSGIKEQIIVVETSAPGSPASYTLTGIGVEPEVPEPSPPEFIFTPEEVNFGNVLVGEQSATQNIGIKATSGTVLEALALLTGDFNLVSDTCNLGLLPTLPYSLPQLDCTLTVAFQPTTEGAQEQVMEAKTSAPDSPASYTLKGNGVAPGRVYTAPLPSGNEGSLSFTSPDAGCVFDGDPRFLAEGGVTPPPPDTVELIDGAISFSIGSCTPGATVNLTMDYGAALPTEAGVVKAGDPYRVIPATISGSTATFSITDGGEFDADGEANGTIVDPSGAAIVDPDGIVPGPGPGPSEPRAIPVNNPLLLMMLALGLGILGAWRYRQAHQR
jgi:HYDIN/CFA65/VesB-like, Ig-like domain